MTLTQAQQEKLTAAGFDWKKLAAMVLKLILTLFADEKPQVAGDPKALALTITKDQFRDKAQKALMVASFLATLTPTAKDDAAVSLLSHLFSEPEHFDQICTMLGIV